jgi:hypothetical protein
VSSDKPPSGGFFHGSIQMTFRDIVFGISSLVLANGSSVYFLALSSP